jgi:DNA primase
MAAESGSFPEPLVVSQPNKGVIMPKNAPRFVDFRALKAAVSMEQVLTHYGVLDQFKRGKDSLSGPCPIHHGTNPTQFRVSVSKNCWNCFGDCHGGGNVLDFVAQMENIEPLEAANRLVTWFDLDRGQLNTGHDRKESQEPKASPAKPASPKPATDLTREPDPPPDRFPTLTKKPETAENKPLGFQLELDPSHPYLTERGLASETIKEFGLGYCAKGVMAQRIAIPIHNVKGELVGYAGRWPGTPPEERPKYRLPDGFKKAAEIYRLAQALREPAELPLVIVEGFFDAMILWQHGVRKTVALMGSSLSAAQEMLLAQRLSPSSRVIVMFDEDDAGRHGRDDVLSRLSTKAFVRVVSFAEEEFQPENLSADQIVELGLNATSP